MDKGEDKGEDKEEGLSIKEQKQIYLSPRALA